MLLASKGQRAGMLQNILQIHDSTPREEVAAIPKDSNTTAKPCLKRWYFVSRGNPQILKYNFMFKLMAYLPMS